MYVFHKQLVDICLWVCGNTASGRSSSATTHQLLLVLYHEKTLMVKVMIDSPLKKKQLLLSAYHITSYHIILFTHLIVIYLGSLN